MISVCIATHNGEKYIKLQVESILSQLGENDELIVSDDGSTDNTLAIIGSFKDDRIKVYHYIQSRKSKHPHEYVCKNFENALRHANGDYIFLSDQDDEWMPNKVAVCLEDLIDHDLVLHDFSHINENEIILKHLHYNGKFRPHNFLLLHEGKYYGCAMAFRRNVLNYALPFPKHIYLHDFWIGILVEILGLLYYEKEPLIKYRIHVDNTSDTHNSIPFKLLYRLHILFNVFFRVIKIKLKNNIVRINKLK